MKIIEFVFLFCMYFTCFMIGNFYGKSTNENQIVELKIEIVQLKSKVVSLEAKETIKRVMDLDKKIGKKE